MPLFTTQNADDTDSTETRWVPSYVLLHLLKFTIKCLCARAAKWYGGKRSMSGSGVRLFVCTFHLSVFGRWQHRVDCTTPSTAVIFIDQKSNVFISWGGWQHCRIDYHFHMHRHRHSSDPPNDMYWMVSIFFFDWSTPSYAWIRCNPEKMKKNNMKLSSMATHTIRDVGVWECNTLDFVWAQTQRANEIDEDGMGETNVCKVFMHAIVLKMTLAFPIQYKKNGPRGHGHVASAKIELISMLRRYEYWIFNRDDFIVATLRCCSWKINWNAVESDSLS